MTVAEHRQARQDRLAAIEPADGTELETSVNRAGPENTADPDAERERQKGIEFDLVIVNLTDLDLGLGCGVDDIARTAARDLRPGGTLATVGPNSSVGSVFEAVSCSELTFRCIVNIRQEGLSADEDASISHPSGTPVLLFDRGDPCRPRLGTDYIELVRPMPGIPSWKVWALGFETLITSLTDPRAVVVTPNLDARAVEQACRVTGRRFSPFTISDIGEALR